MKKRFLFSAMSLIIAISAFVLWDTYQRENILLEIQSFALPSENLESTPTKTLRMYRYLIETRLNPLFAIPGTDTTLLRTSIDALEKSRDVFLQSFTEEERARLPKKLYPIDFFRLLADSEDARQEFISHPSLENASAYHSALSATIEEYGKSLQAASDTLHSFDQKTIAFWQGTTNAPFIAQTLDHVADVVEKRAHEEKRRFYCLQYGILCAQLTGLTSSPEISLQSPRAMPTALPDIIERNKHIIEVRIDRPEQTLIQWGEEWHARQVRGIDTFSAAETFNTLPVVYLDNALCTIGGEAAYVRFWWSNSRASSIPITRIAFLNDIYFRDLTNAQSELERELLDKGVPYVYQPTSPFICADFSNDATSVFSLYYIQRELLNHPLFTHEIRSDDSRIQEIVRAEENIRLSKQRISTAAMEEYVTLLKRYIEEQGDASLASILGYDDVKAVEHIVNVWNSKSAWLEYALGYFDDENITTRLLAQYHDLTTEELFLVRSYISGMYLLSNETIVQQPISLIQKQHAYTLETVGIVGYNETLVSQFSPEAMAQYMISSDGILNTLKK